MKKYLWWYDNGSGYFDCGGETNAATVEEARRLQKEEVRWSSEVRITDLDDKAILASSRQQEEGT